MKKNEFNANQRFQPDLNEENHEPEGYPLYPENEDVYTKFKKEKRIDPETITQFKEKEIVGTGKEEDSNDDSAVSELEITEAEPDELSGYPEIDEDFYSALGDNDYPDIDENPYL